MKDRKKQVTAVIMTMTLALMTTTATSATLVYAQDADETTQIESSISDDSDAEVQKTDTTVEKEITEDLKTATPMEDEIETSNNTTTSSVQKAMTRSIKNDEDNGISAQAEGDIEINETNFPDATFREYVKSYFDKNDDNKLSQEELENVTGIYVSNNSAIKDLTGIKYFTSLTHLYCSNTGITGLDVSENTFLKYLDCSYTGITELDISKNKDLLYLYCFNTGITSLNVTENTALTRLYCYNTGITTLDISKNTDLIYLWCYNTKITSLDVSNNTDLEYLSCYDTKIASLDVSENTSLKHLQCYNTAIEKLDVSNNTALEYLYCYNTDITELDVSKNTALTRLYCYYMAITELDLSKNTALEYLYCYNTEITGLDLSNNPSLKTIHCTSVNLAYLNLSSEINATVFINNTSKIDITDRVGSSFNITEMFPGIDTSKITIKSGGTLDKDTGVVSGYTNGTPIVYMYDCGTVKGTKYTLTVTLNLTVNQPPIITAEDKTLAVGDTFNPMDGVTATDKEDGDLTNEIKVTSNNVDVSIIGNYSVTYEVTDSQGESTTKTIKVTVNPKMETLNEVPVITAEDKTLTVGDTFNPLDGVTAIDKEDGNLTDEIKIISNDVDTSSSGTYTVTYKVTDSQGASTTKTIKVTINPKMETLNEVPVINASDKTLTVGDTFKPLDGVTATDKEDGDLTDKIEVTYNDVDTSKAGTYSVTYKVTDSQGASVTKTITVSVKEKDDTNNPSDEQKPNDNGNTAKPSDTDKNSTDKVTSPKTGDSSNIGLYTSLLAMSGLLIAILAVLRKKKAFGHK